MSKSTPARATRSRARRATGQSPSMQRWIASTVASISRRAASARDVAVTQAEGTRKAVAARVGDARQRTGATFSRLETVFEKRVSRSLARLGVPSPREVRALSRDVAALQRAVEQLRRRRA